MTLVENNQFKRFPSFVLEIKSKKSEIALSFDFPTTLRPKGVQYLDWRLLQYMYDRYFKYGRTCFVKASTLARILSPGSGSAASIRNSRCRLKKAGLITVQNARSDFSMKTVAYCFMTEKSQQLMTEFFKNKKKQPKEQAVDTEENVLQRTPTQKEVKPDKKYTDFDYRASKRFARDIQLAYPMKGQPPWSEEWADSFRKLRVLDGFTEEQIKETVKYILADVNPRGSRGFCYAKVLRSGLQLRTKWRNGMTKFASAYEDMRAEKMVDPDINDEENLPFALRDAVSENGETSKRKVFTPPREVTSDNEFYQKTCEAYEKLLSLPTPNWKYSAKNFLEHEQFCYDLSLFFEELIMDRNWSSDVIDHFFQVLQVDNKNLQFYTADILRDKVKVFFKDRVDKYFGSDIGKFNQWAQLNDKIVVKNDDDEDYLQRVYDFLEDQKQLKPFDRATEIIEDEEVEYGSQWEKIEKGQFRQIRLGV